MAKEFLRTNDRIFASRPPSAAAKYLLYNSSDVVFAPLGPYWRQMRKVCVSQVLHSKRIEYFHYIREEEVSAMIRSLMNSVHQPVNITKIVSGLVTDIMCRMVFGRKYSDRDIIGNIGFVSMVKEIVALSGSFNIGDYIPYLAWMDLQGFSRRFKKVRKSQDDFLEKVIDDHAAQNDANAPRDLVDVLIAASVDKNAEFQPSRDNIKAVLLDMLAAGTDTASTSIDWTMVELLKNPPVMFFTTDLAFALFRGFNSLARHARVLAIVLSTLFLLAVSVSAARSFEETGYIDMVTDKIQNLESNFVKILGTNPKSLQFAEFAARYGKRYDSVRQIVQRFNVFVKNVELIESRNRMKLPYTLAINEFADITWEEFHGQYLGASQNCSATNSNHKLTYAQLPAEKDWRQEGIVSPVKNQAHCGSCWTFSTTGALEAAYTQATGKTVILSEQQLVDCAGAFNNFGCSGGLPSQAFEYIKYNGGLDTEEAYPYLAKDGVCKYDVNNVGVKVADSVNISLGAEDELKAAVGLVRPVSVAFQVNQEFRFYKEGVFTSTNCGQGPMDVNHAVLAVGYGVSEEGTPHWIIKNSWGKSWGVDGYFKMELGKNMCGVATCASYPIVS